MLIHTSFVSQPVASLHGAMRNIIDAKINTRGKSISSFLVYARNIAQRVTIIVYPRRVYGSLEGSHNKIGFI